ncbi:alanine/glycine:cation symporter family protein [Glutamicibacter endophyticus]
MPRLPVVSDVMNWLQNEDVATWLGDQGNVLWGNIVLPVVIAAGLYFTIRTGAVQLRLLPNMLKTLTDKALVDENGNKKSISAFQAFTISAASRVGVGNIAGVATAIAVGGAGAVFWMWTMAFIGGASSFVESTLGQLYKRQGKDGYRGGPAYYMQHGLGARWLGIIFAIILVVTFPFAFSSLQANTITATITGAVGLDAAADAAQITTLSWVIGAALAVLTALVVFGGVRRIAKVTESLVPAMAVLYIVLGIVVVSMNIGQLPHVFGMIYSEAFNFNSAIGGGLGMVLLTGVKRGMFSNEAGLGSAPNAGATASVTHPVKQGLVQTLGVYFDTFIVCTVTAFIILHTVPDAVGSEGGVAITQLGLTNALGSWTGTLLAVIIFLLAFSSVIGNYYYGEANIGFITSNPTVMTVYRLLASLAVLGGAVAASSVVWNFADGIMGIMALLNLVAIILLSPKAMALLKHYTAQLRDGKDPVFLASDMPGLRGIECWEPSDVRTQ